jgi:putative signal transducing protein
LKRIYSSHDRAAVHHCRNLLEAEGIPAVVKNEFLSSAMGELPPAECQAEVWVLRETDAPRAEEFLKNASCVKGGTPWRCTCGESLEPQFTHCWRCGAGRP